MNGTRKLKELRKMNSWGRWNKGCQGERGDGAWDAWAWADQKFKEHSINTEKRLCRAWECPCLAGWWGRRLIFNWMGFWGFGVLGFWGFGVLEVFKY